MFSFLHYNLIETQSQDTQFLFLYSNMAAFCDEDGCDSAHKDLLNKFLKISLCICYHIQRITMTKIRKFG